MNIAVEDKYYHYVLGALTTPIQDRHQLDSMVILHFDICDEKAHEIVTKSLVIYLAMLRRTETKLKSELSQTQRLIGRLVELTPEID